MTDVDILHGYVVRHNDAVRTGDFAPLLNLFAPSAYLVIEGVGMGPFEGRERIAEAFRHHPPGDELEILHVSADARGLTADYGWRSRPGIRAGRLQMSFEGATIGRLEISVGS